MSEKTEKQILGDLGERIAAKYLQNKDFAVIGRNYRKKWGEIDIIAQKARKLHFIEVKTVSCESLEAISRVTDTYRPEDNIHPQKLKRLGRAIQSYILEHFPEKDPEWVFDAITVRVEKGSKKARVKYISDIVL